MAKYRIRVSEKADGVVTYEPQRLFFRIFWVTLKEHSSYDSWPLIYMTEADAVEAIREDKKLDASLTEVGHSYKEID